MSSQIIYSIYKIRNIINGKVYIGFTKDYTQRILKHKSNSDSVDRYLYRAIRKYDWCNFECSILYQSLDKAHTLNVMENHFITEYNSFSENGYNMTRGGEGGLHLPITLECISKKAKVRWSDENGVYGQDFRNKISLTVSKLHSNADIYGESWKQKKKEASSKFWNSTESNTLRQLIGQKSKSRWSDEDYRKTACASMKGKYRIYYSFVDPQGTTIEQFGDLVGFCKRNDLDMSCIYSVINGKRKSHKGWTVTKITCP